jgi:hypothetical protein
MFRILVTFHRSIETQRKAILRDHTTSLPLYTEKSEPYSSSSHRSSGTSNDKM